MIGWIGLGIGLMKLGIGLMELGIGLIELVIGRLGLGIGLIDSSPQRFYCIGWIGRIDMPVTWVFSRPGRRC